MIHISLIIKKLIFEKYLDIEFEIKKKKFIWRNIIGRNEKYKVVDK